MVILAMGIGLFSPPFGVDITPRRLSRLERSSSPLFLSCPDPRAQAKNTWRRTLE
jgi:hypothetical protein